MRSADGTFVAPVVLPADDVQLAQDRNVASLVEVLSDAAPADRTAELETEVEDLLQEHANPTRQDSPQQGLHVA
jgi:hypothetical protein